MSGISALSHRSMRFSRLTGGFHTVKATDQLCLFSKAEAHVNAYMSVLFILPPFPLEINFPSAQQKLAHLTQFNSYQQQ